MKDLIQSAINEETSQEYNFFLQGDLCQMSTQKTFLVNRGVSTKQNNVYPCLRQMDVKMALELIYTNRVEGWWHYEQKCIDLGICTKEEWDKH